MGKYIQTYSPQHRNRQKPTQRHSYIEISDHRERERYMDRNTYSQVLIQAHTQGQPTQLISNIDSSSQNWWTHTKRKRCAQKKMKRPIPIDVHKNVSKTKITRAKKSKKQGYMVRETWTKASRQMHQKVCTKKHVDTLGKAKDAEKQTHREWLIHKPKQSPPNRFAEAHKDPTRHRNPYTDRKKELYTLTHWHMGLEWQMPTKI